MSYESVLEDMCVGVKDYVQDNIGPYLAGIAGVNDDGIDLSNFRLIEVGERELYAITLVPACIVYPEGATITALTMGADTIKVKLLFCVVLAGSNQDHLLFAALRYTEALRELFTADSTCGNVVDGMGPEMTIDYIPGVTGPTNKKGIIFGATFFKDVNR